MREIVVLASIAIATLLGMAIGFVCGPTEGLQMTNRSASTVAAADAEISPGSEAVVAETSTKAVTKIVGVKDWEDSELSPVVAVVWTNETKEVVVRHVKALSPKEAEYLCFTLGLIPRDEVFDHVNARGRLLRYVDRMSGPGDLRELNAAFAQMAMR